MELSSSANLKFLLLKNLVSQKNKRGLVGPLLLRSKNILPGSIIIKTVFMEIEPVLAGNIFQNPFFQVTKNYGL